VAAARNNADGEGTNNGGAGRVKPAGDGAGDNGAANTATAGRTPAGQTSGSQTAGRRPAAGKDARPAYEQARDELTELVKRLEAGGLTLEQSLRLWERGEELAAICEEWLEGARARLATALARQDKSDPAPGAPF
jgi:exodeoxyribonuclease VII small subunit